MPSDKNCSIPRSLAIAIKPGPDGMDSAAAEALAARIATLVAEEGHSVQVHNLLGGGEIYIGTRPDKRQRLAAIEELAATLTTVQIAARLGLTERQVYRYRALLKNISAP